MTGEKDFFKWLLDQKHRNDPVGDIASDLVADIKLTKINNYYFEELKNYLQHGLDVDFRVVEILDEAYLEWKLKIFKSEQAERKKILKKSRELFYPPYKRTGRMNREINGEYGSTRK